jgi:tetratricopeptide (TPR) repeat protein
MGEYSKSLCSHEKALEIKQQSLPRNHPDLAASYNNIGVVYDSMGEYSKARSFYELAVNIG